MGEIKVKEEEMEKIAVEPETLHKPFRYLFPHRYGERCVAHRVHWRPRGVVQ